MHYGMIATGNHCNSDSLRGAPLPAVKCTDYMSVSAKTYCITGAMNGSPTAKTQCVQNRQTPICRSPVTRSQPRTASSPSVTSTAAELTRATVMRLYPRQAVNTAAARAAAPLMTELVLDKMAGKVMALRQA